MADQKPERTERPRVPHEYATKEPPERRKQAAAEAKRPIRRTGLLFKFIGMLLVLAAAWWAWLCYRKGGFVDPTDQKQQQEALNQLHSDAKDISDATRNASIAAIDWAKQSLGDLEKFIKGKPPKSPEEIKQLVDESKREVEKEQARPAAPQPSTPAAAPTPPSPLAAAQAEYRAGQEAYAKTDPAGQQEVIQKYLRVAEPHFVKCLDLCDGLRQKGINGDEIGRLEQSAARRLYDCRKRMELKNGER